MEHEKLTLEDDKDLINKILDDIDMRYIVLFLYVIRNDLFKDLTNQKLIDSYQRVLSLDEIFKGNLLNFWTEEFIELFIDLGLIKNIRSYREFEQKDNDFILKLGEETVTVEQGTILTPDDILFLIIAKKFKFLTRRNFNLALTRLKAVRCEKTGIIHPFIFQISDHDYALSNDLYYIMDHFGNIYQAIKIEVTIEGFYQRFKEIQNKISEYIEIFDPNLVGKNCLRKIYKAIEEKKEIIKYLKEEEKIKLSDKFEFDKIDKSVKIFKKWQKELIKLLNFSFQMKELDKKLLDIKNYYSGKNKKYSYLEFIEKVSFNEENIINEIQNSLIELRTILIKIDEEVSQLTRKSVKLLNLDYERFLLNFSDE